jgi:Mrp family chromosome partitioning ATPase/capsular polysaccharide biosynthesis protein
LPDAARQESTIRDYVRLLLRRKWIVLAVVVLVPTAAVFFSLRQPSLYRASAQVLLKQGNLAATLSGIQDTSVYLDPNRVAQTQIELASTPTVAARVLKSAGVNDRSPGALLASVRISPEPNADILDFSVSDHDPALAVRLANAYAREYTVFRRQLDTASLNNALTDVTRRITELKAAGQTSYARSLVSKEQQLRTLKAIEDSNAVVARPADGTVKVQPTPKRYGVLGLALGVMLGIGLALIWDALDTRIRSADEIAQRLGLPLLARLPAPTKQIQKIDGLVMLEHPTSVEAEAFRVLRTNLDFVNVERNARSIMITSALEEEGKSTTVANLAIALARTGRRVVLVDLDLRRPYLDRFFKLDGRPGVTNVVLGHATLEEATTRVAVPVVEQSGNAGYEGNGHSPVGGFLDVLPSGPIPPDAGEFVGTGAVAHILRELSHRYDVVLIDTPPILHVGDALTLASEVDALILVTRLPTVRRPILKELKRVLENCPGVKLGFALAGAQLEEGYGYGYGYYYSSYSARPRGERSGERVR